jgi:hypothetical protein
MKTEPPLCKCGKFCGYYGPIGGYGKLCLECAAAKATKQRAARRRRNPNGPLQ